jgi:biotin transport system substrate-specific component
MKSQVLSREMLRSAAARRVAVILAGIGLLAASAWLSVPFYPVPLTMQTLAVLLLGGLLGPTLGVSAVAGYLVLGAMGAPVFHNGLGGVLVIAGPTGGYLVGFLPAVWLMGWGARQARSGVGGGRRARSLLFLATGAVAAGAVIYAAGVPWLAVSTGMGLRSAVAAGLVPFLLGDLLKTAVAVGALHLGGKALARRGSLPL